MARPKLVEALDWIRCNRSAFELRLSKDDITVRAQQVEEVSEIEVLAAMVEVPEDADPWLFEERVLDFYEDCNTGYEEVD